MYILVINRDKTKRSNREKMFLKEPLKRDLGSGVVLFSQSQAWDTLLERLQ